MPKKPLVTVLISSFNRLSDLKETIQKVKDIKYDNLEILVVDGHSTDGTIEYLENLKFKSLIIYILDKDFGSAYTHTFGMKKARGEIIICLDDDCYLSKKVIEETVRIFKKYKNLGTIGFGLINPKTDYDEKLFLCNKVINDEKYNINECYEVKNYASAQAYRSDVLKEVGYMDLNWSWGTNTEDLDLNYSIISRGYNSVKIDELISFHKVSPSNRNANLWTKNRINGMFWIILKHYPFQKMIEYYFKFLSLCFYYSFKHLTLIYLIGFVNSLKKSLIFIKNKHRVRKNIFYKVDVPLGWYFSISKNPKWFGE